MQPLGNICNDYSSHLLLAVWQTGDVSVTTVQVDVKMSTGVGLSEMYSDLLWAAASFTLLSIPTDGRR